MDYSELNAGVSILGSVIAAVVGLAVLAYVYWPRKGT